jgi:putative transposase
MTAQGQSGTVTYRYRLKDRHASALCQRAQAVNIVWNYCNEMQQKAARSGRKWLSASELQRLTSGSSILLGIPAQTVCRVCMQYVVSRQRHRMAWLRFRGHRSLGWIPAHQECLRLRDGGVVFGGIHFAFMHQRQIPAGARLLNSTFSADARGRWYLNLALSVERSAASSGPSVGIDLGLHSLATLSTGRSIDAPRFFRQSEMAIASSQRNRKSKRVHAIHAKIANRRKDFLHKLSKGLADEFGLIVVGNVSPSKLARTGMAKSIHDAGWATFKDMLAYKTHLRGGRFLEVPEAYTTQVCSECGALPSSRPRGIADLGIREWACDCGAVHDRDVNAAKNILRLGLQSLAEGAAQMRSSQSVVVWGDRP